MIVAQVLTDGNADDDATVPDLLGQFEGELSGFVADAAYDSRPVYDAATQREGRSLSFLQRGTPLLAEET